MNIRIYTGIRDRKINLNEQLINKN